MGDIELNVYKVSIRQRYFISTVLYKRKLRFLIEHCLKNELSINKQYQQINKLEIAIKSQSRLT